MKLQILIPRYNDDPTLLLTSIALQQKVNFAEIGVIICDDGSDEPLALDAYPFEVDYYACRHRGVSATRNACLTLATAEYVMFCDADDMFMNSIGLWMVFNSMPFDSLLSEFLEETNIPDVPFLTHSDDGVFVHGKIHRRQYLLDNNIWFDERLLIHEDSYFNLLVQACTEDLKYCKMPFYLWKWNPDSVCRHDPMYGLKTYNAFIDSVEAILNEFLRRGLTDRARNHMVKIVYETYYSMNKPEWADTEYRAPTESRFREFFSKYRSLWDEAPDLDKLKVSNIVRQRLLAEGMGMEKQTLEEWLGE